MYLRHLILDQSLVQTILFAQVHEVKPKYQKKLLQHQIQNGLSAAKLLQSPYQACNKMLENLSLVFEACDIRVDNDLPDALATQGVLALLCH